MPEIPSAPVKTPVFSAPKSSDAPTPSSQSRKRRQEPLDYDDMRNKSSNDYGKAEREPSSTSTPSIKSSLFGGSAKSGEITSTPTVNSSLFGTKSSETPNTPASNNSLFGTKSNETTSDEKTNTPPTNNFLFGSKPDEKTNTLSSNNSLFGTKPGETTSNNSLFGGSVKSNEASNAVPITSSLFGGLVKPGETTNTLSSNNSLFGGLVKPGQLSFNFKGPENSATSAPTNGGADNKDGEEGDAEDAPPPKAEIVKHEEPDAAFSTKCSLFNFVNGEYKKVGVGFMHIKKTESGTQLLIRAATALGTVWINTYINDSFKAEKKAKDKIQFSYPSAEGAKTSLVRVVDAETAVTYLTGEKKP
uniref:RanBD1 domain-containing protein n=1 Tax=Panagrolaimus sp. ES5 TaxID=591445 RepID=A0AC34FQ05_9BILA